ncbi:hypothetical protein B0G52_108143 [Cohnella sp. SGD-V74]|nr:hypothetical protein B0G52_108143 [Cohnella sp. SGD-V74]
MNDVDGDRTFQSTLPHGERQQKLYTQYMQDRFNPRSRTGSDSNSYPIETGYTGFNPRSRTGSDIHVATGLSVKIGFNPRSRTGSDSRGSLVRPRDGVSIHAPARGATDHKRETLIMIECFNPRSRTGSDSIAIIPYPARDLGSFPRTSFSEVFCWRHSRVKMPRSLILRAARTSLENDVSLGFAKAAIVFILS